MAISNYGELKTAVGEWLAKSNLSSRAADFITLASTRIYYGSADPLMPSAPVRIQEMQAQESPTLTVGVGASVFDYPTGYIETKRIQASSSGSDFWNLEYVSPGAFSRNRRDGYFQYYTFLDGRIFVTGTIGTIIHNYEKKFDDFSADSDSNALLVKAPGLWLYGAMIEAAAYQMNDEAMMRSYRMFSSIASSITKATKHVGPAPSMKVV